MPDILVFQPGGEGKWNHPMFKLYARCSLLFAVLSENISASLCLCGGL